MRRNMMNQYNRQNPFMYLMESKESESVQKTEFLIKKMIKCGVFGGINIILLIIHTIFTKNLSFHIILILFISFLFVWQFLQIRLIIRTLNIQETNEMIFGDQYENIDLNNEKLLIKINKINVQLGKIEFTNEYIIFVNSLYSIILGYNLCEFIRLIIN